MKKLVILMLAMVVLMAFCSYSIVVQANGGEATPTLAPDTPFPYETLPPAERATMIAERTPEPEGEKPLKKAKRTPTPTATVAPYPAPQVQDVNWFELLLEWIGTWY